MTFADPSEICIHLLVFLSRRQNPQRQLETICIYRAKIEWRFVPELKNTTSPNFGVFHALRYRATHKCSYNKRKTSERRNKYGKMIEDDGNASILLNTVNVI